MIFKDERQVPVKKNLRLASAERPEGPYREASEPFTPEWVEGPTAIRIGSEWVVYFDRYREHRYGAVKSKDLLHWVDVSERSCFSKGPPSRIGFEDFKSIADQLSGTR
jgi:hypothetical protein